MNTNLRASTFKLSAGLLCLVSLVAPCGALQKSEPEPASSTVPLHTDLEMIGLTVQPSPDGSYAVSGVLRQNGKALVDGVAAGDKLIRIDDLEVSGASLAGVISALRGKIGTKRSLTLERDGKRITVTAAVSRIL